MCVRAKRMLRIIFTSVACLGLPYFSTLSHKPYCFRENNVIEHKVFFLYNFCLKHVILGRILRNMIKVHRSLVKYPLRVSDFNQI